MDDQKQRVIDSIKQANNVLVTVKNSPSIDQLAACIALTLVINELGKHGTAVFSGQVPSVLEFLEPEKTIERNTDSLRDFIISLDKAKADKLRYKVEDTVVKIFITPYRTSLSGNDLEFGQGDFNVDVVVALGVHEQNDLDEAITAHGRILHDATVISLNTSGDVDQDLGSISWTDGEVSSLSEMVAHIAEQLGPNKGAGKDKNGDVDSKDSKIGESVIDNQIATALLTGIVAETERFGNSKTKPATMEVAAKLLAAGANQELVASHLAEPVVVESDPYGNNSGGPQDGPTSPGSGPTDAFAVPDTSFKVNNDGELSIDHPYGEYGGSTGEAQDRGPTEPVEATLPMPAPVYNPGQPGPDGPSYAGGVDNMPSMPTPTPTTPPTPPTLSASQEPPQQSSGEDLEALDYLKEHKVDTSNSRVLQPLHDLDHLEGLPKIGPALTAPSDDAPPADDKYALTPPSMGGTLTANLPNLPSEDEGLGAAPARMAASAPPILRHGRPEGSAALTSTAPPESAAKALKTLAPSEAKASSESGTKPKAAADNNGQPPKLEAAPLPDAGAQPAETPKAPVATASAGPQPASRPIEATPLEAKPMMHGTLADLEAEVHSPHEAAGTSPSGAADMPSASASLKLPSPQTTSSTDRPQVSALAPPPPVPPPIPPL